MKEIVIDSSVAVKWFVPQPNSGKAQELLNAYQNSELLLLAPDLIYAEVGNVIWKMSRFQNLVQTDAIAVLEAFRTIEFLITPSSVLLQEAYRFAAMYERTVYDSLYVILSLRRKCPFITADEKLANSIGKTFPNVVKISDWR